MQYPVRRYIGYACIVCLLALAPLLSLAKDKKKPPEIRVTMSDPWIPFYDAETGNLEWLLLAEKASQKKPGLYEATKLKLTLYDEQRGEVTIAAPHGHIAENRVRLTGGTVINAKGDQPITVKTQYLEWDIEQSLATTDAPVTIESTDLSMKGIGLLATFGKRDIHGRIQPVKITLQEQADMTLTGALAKDTVDSDTDSSQEDDTSLHLTCDGKAVLDRPGRTVTFHDNVEMTLTGKLADEAISLHPNSAQKDDTSLHITCDDKAVLFRPDKSVTFYENIVATKGLLTMKANEMRLKSGSKMPKTSLGGQAQPSNE